MTKYRVQLTITTTVVSYPVEAESEREAGRSIASKIEDMLNRDYDLDDFEVESTEVEEWD